MIFRKDGYDGSMVALRGRPCDKQGMTPEKIEKHYRAALARAIILSATSPARAATAREQGVRTFRRMYHKRLANTVARVAFLDHVLQEAQPLWKAAESATRVRRLLRERAVCFRELEAAGLRPDTDSAGIERSTLDRLWVVTAAFQAAP